VIIENCEIFGFASNGINVTTAGSKIVVTHTNSSNNTGSGIAITSSR